MGFELKRTDASRESGDRLERAARRLVSRAGEEWTLAIEAGFSGLTLVACGPCRTELPAEWVREAPEGTDRDRWRYRRTLASAPERSPEVIEQSVRDLVWQPFEILPHALRRTAVVGFDPPPAWRWWSPLVATPEELAADLAEALRSRRPRATVTPSPRQQFWGWGAAGQAGA